MPADTVNVLGKPVNKKVLYVGGAVAGGAVIYAWYTSSSGGIGTREEPEPELPEPVPEPTDEPGFGVSGGGPPPQTNADWNDKAVQSLLNLGYDAIAVQAAIGKFLQRRALNTTEAALVEAAIAAAGYPPENGPWVIIRAAPIETPPTPKPGPVKVPGAPANVGVSYAKKTVAFDAVATATKYQWRAHSGKKALTNWQWGKPRPTQNLFRFRFARGTRFFVEAHAGNAAGWGPVGRSGTITVTK